MATWSRKTYQMVADILHEAYKDRDMVNIWDLMQRFGVEFRMDNPNFDEARFRKASIGGNTEPAGQEPTYEDAGDSRGHGRVDQGGDSE